MFGFEPRCAYCYTSCVNCWIANKDGQGPRRNFNARFSLSYQKQCLFSWYRLDQCFWTICGRVARRYFMNIAVLYLVCPSLEWVATMGHGTKWVENHWPRRFSQNKDWSLDPLPTVLLYSVKLLKIHMWVAANRETVIERINIINSPTNKIFQAHVLTRIWGIRWKTIGKNILTSLAYLIGNCEWMALLTRFWVASAGIFSTKYNLNIYTENSFKLLHILQVIKKSNIYIGYTKYIRMTPI